MGFAGNVEPQYIIPTTISLPNSQGKSSFVDSKRGGVEDLDFYIGTDCAKHTSSHSINYPIRHGLIEVSRRRVGGDGCGETVYLGRKNGVWKLRKL